MAIAVALSTYCVLSRSSGKEVYPPSASAPLGCCRPRDVVPHLEAMGHDVALRGDREPVAARSDVVGERSIRGEEPRRMTRRLEPLQAPLTLASRLM